MNLVAAEVSIDNRRFIFGGSEHLIKIDSRFHAHGIEHINQVF